MLLEFLASNSPPLDFSRVTVIVILIYIIIVIIIILIIIIIIIMVVVIIIEKEILFIEKCSLKYEGDLVFE